MRPVYPLREKGRNLSMTRSIYEVAKGAQGQCWIRRTYKEVVFYSIILCCLFFAKLSHAAFVPAPPNIDTVNNFEFGFNWNFQNDAANPSAIPRGVNWDALLTSASNPTNPVGEDLTVTGLHVIFPH